MKSDKAKPKMHTMMPAGKTNQPAAPASAGTSEHPTKSHEADIALGEGNEYGASNLNHEKARKAKVHSEGIQESRDNQARRENGNADPCGCPAGDCACS